MLGQCIPDLLSAAPPTLAGANDDGAVPAVLVGSSHDPRCVLHSVVVSRESGGEAALGLGQTAELARLAQPQPDAAQQGAASASDERIKGIDGFALADGGALAHIFSCFFHAENTH